MEATEVALFSLRIILIVALLRLLHLHNQLFHSHLILNERLKLLVVLQPDRRTA